MGLNHCVQTGASCVSVGPTQACHEQVCHRTPVVAHTLLCAADSGHLSLTDYVTNQETPVFSRTQPDAAEEA
jgi:hypothetical protein